MAVHVCFITPKGIGSVHAPGPGQVRIREAVAVPGVSSASAQEGEIALIYNDTAATILAAVGTTPDASAAASTGTTNAGLPVFAGTACEPLICGKGMKVGLSAIA